jgi:hypothetical protein
MITVIRLNLRFPRIPKVQGKMHSKTSRRIVFFEARLKSSNSAAALEETTAALLR